MPETEHYDCLWRNARLVTLASEHDELGIVEPGAIACQDGRVHFAGLEIEAPAAAQARRVVDCEGRWITPGLIDVTRISYLPAIALGNSRGG